MSASLKLGLNSPVASRCTQIKAAAPSVRGHFLCSTQPLPASEHTMVPPGCGVFTSAWKALSLIFQESFLSLKS